jgi:hypothetical protein
VTALSREMQSASPPLRVAAASHAHYYYAQPDKSRGASPAELRWPWYAAPSTRPSLA